MPKRSEVLITSVGLFPQLVTLMLDLLMEQPGRNISDVVVLHTRPDPSTPPQRKGDRTPYELHRTCMRMLNSEFANGLYRDDRPCRLHVQPLTHPDGQHLEDVRTREEMSIFWGDAYRTVRDYKARGFRIHLSVAAGRKPMALYSLVTAQLLLQADDFVWNLLTEARAEQTALHLDERVNGRAFHATLEQIQFIPLQDQTNVIFAEGEEGPEVVIAGVLNKQAREELRRIAAFMGDYRDDHHPDNLTPAQAEIAALVAKGFSNQEIADQLNKALSTIKGALTEDIYPKLATRFGIEHKVKRPVLMNKLLNYLDWVDRGRPPLD